MKRASLIVISAIGFVLGIVIYCLNALLEWLERFDAWLQSAWEENL